MIFLTALESVFSIVALIALGYALHRRNWFADTFSANLSRLIMNAALPASVFVSVLEYLNRDKLAALSDGLIYGALSVVIGYLPAWAAVKVLHIRPGRRGTFVNTVVNANTIFIGLPLNTALFGSEAMPYFLVYYVLNTVSTWAVGVYFISADPSEPVAHAQKTPIQLEKTAARAALGLSDCAGVSAGRHFAAVIRTKPAAIPRRNRNPAVAALHRYHAGRRGLEQHPFRP